MVTLPLLVLMLAPALLVVRLLVLALMLAIALWLPSPAVSEGRSALEKDQQRSALGEGHPAGSARVDRNERRVTRDAGKGGRKQS